MPPRGLRTSFEGVLAGSCAGVLIGVAEAGWLSSRAPDVSAVPLLLWAATAYALSCAPLGLAVAWGMPGLAWVVGRTTGRTLHANDVAVPAFAGALLLCGVWVGRARFYMDVAPSRETAPAPLLVVGVSLACGLALAVAVVAVARWRGARALFAGSLILSGLAALGLALRHPAPTTPASEIPVDAPVEALAKPGSPDVFLIVADTLGARYLNLYDRDAPARTPTLDALAADGVLVADHCAQSSWTKPGFASIVTGLRPRRHAALDQDAELPEGATTVAEVFAAHGYETLGYSNVNPNNSSGANFDQGFEHFIDLSPSDAWLGAPWSGTSLVLYRQAISPLAKRLVGANAHHFYQPADAYTDLVLKRLRERRDHRPLFALLHYMDPHSPYMGGRVQGRPMSGNPGHPAADTVSPEQLIRGHTADIEFMDAHLGRLVDGLRQLDLYEDAVIAFTSDHGEEIYEHAAWGHGDSLYEEVLRIPLILKLPKGAGKGTTRPGLTQQIDVAPTLLSLAGLEVPGEMTGRPVLGRDGTPPAEAAGFCFSTLQSRGNDMDAARNQGATLIRTRETDQERLAPFELYDLRRDPGQQRNLAGQGDPREGALEAALDQALDRDEANSLDASQMQTGSELESRLRALGYLE